MNDWQLLRDYVEHNSQSAFATLAERHAGLVYSTCLREVGDAALAEDVAQVVFLLLSRKAASLREGTVLAGWLFQTARFACKNALRQEKRRQQQEQKAAEQMMRETEADKRGWAEIEPLLHDGLSSLAAPERDAVLLRFFQNCSLRETSAALGISEDAARMRVGRALEKLRRHFARHGFAASIAVLAALLSEHAVHAAPASFSAMPLQMPASAGFSPSKLPGSPGALSPKATALSQSLQRTLFVKKTCVAVALGAVLFGSLNALLRPRANPTSSFSTPAVAFATAPRDPLPKTTGLAAVPLSPQPTSLSKWRAPVVVPVAAPRFVAKPSFSPQKLRLQSSPERPKTSIAFKKSAPVRLLQPENSPLEPVVVPAPAPMTEAALPLSASGAVPVENSDKVIISATDVPALPAALPADTLAATITSSDSAKTREPAPATAAEPGIIPNNIHGPKVGNKPGLRRNTTRKRFNSQADMIAGRILEVNESDSTLSIQIPGSGQPIQTITVPVGTQIFLGNQTVNFHEIQAGMSARIRLDAKQSALAIHARRAALNRRPHAANFRVPKGAKKKKRTIRPSTP